MNTPAAAFDMAASHVTAARTSTHRSPAAAWAADVPHRGQPARRRSIAQLSRPLAPFPMERAQARPDTPAGGKTVSVALPHVAHCDRQEAELIGSQNGGRGVGFRWR